MNKLCLILFTVVGILLAGCQQEMPLDDQESLQDIHFDIGTGEKGLKGDSDCYDAADYATIVLTKNKDKQVIVPIFKIDGELQTETIMLNRGTYKISQFMLWDQIGDKPDPANDIPVSASPTITSNFGNLVENPAGEEFTLTTSKRTKVDIDVLCFNIEQSEDFGYPTFRVNLINVREEVFFGDFCSYDFLDYLALPLDDYPNYGEYPKFDMPAIFEIELFKDLYLDGNFTTVGTFRNYEDENGDPSFMSDVTEASIPPLIIPYQDEQGIDDKYKLIIRVLQLVDQGDGKKKLEFVEKEPWYFVNTMDNVFMKADLSGDSFGSGSDNVFDFIAGPCEVLEFDIDLDDPVEGDGDDETAYAYGGDLATCFLEIKDLKNSRWGWTNVINGSKEKDYTFKIYAGAAQCDASKGTYVGVLKVEVYDGEVEVKYEMEEGYVLQEVHLYIGSTILPVLNGEYTVSSGQFPYKEDDLDDVAMYEFNDIDLPNGDFYLIAHAAVTKEK